MLRRGTHTFLFALVTVLHGTVMLIGPGLHGLPGCEHGAMASRAEGHVDAGLAFEVASAPDSSGDSCPVCEYLTQGQLVAERVLVSTPAAAAPWSPILFPSPLDLRAQRTFGCRAPPALALA